MHEFLFYECTACAIRDVLPQLCMRLLVFFLGAFFNPSPLLLLFLSLFDFLLTAPCTTQLTNSQQLSLLSICGFVGWTSGGGWVMQDLYLNSSDSKSSIHSSGGGSSSSSSSRSSSSGSGSTDSGGSSSTKSSSSGGGGSESVASAVSNRLKYMFTDSFASTAVAHSSNVWGLVWEWGPSVSYTTGIATYLYICHKVYVINARRRRWGRRAEKGCREEARASGDA
jgi:hypothetical protein